MKTKPKRLTMLQKIRENQRQQASDTWWNVYFPGMQSSLREGAKAAGLPVREQEKYTISVTQDEVMHGVLENPSLNSQSFAVIRDIEGIMEAEPVDGDKALRAYREGSDEQRLLMDLKTKLKSVLPSNHLIICPLGWKQQVAQN